jgi:hypothetical protein
MVTLYFYIKLVTLNGNMSSACATVHDEPRILLQLLTIGPNPATFLLFLMLIVFKSSSSEYSHLIAVCLLVEYPLVYVELSSCKGSAPAFQKGVQAISTIYFDSLHSSGSLYNL